MTKREAFEAEQKRVGWSGPWGFDLQQNGAYCNAQLQVLWENYCAGWEAALKETPTYKPTFKLSALSIEEQLMARSYGGKCCMGYWSADGSFHTWISDSCNYYEKLFITDAWARRMTTEFERNQPREGE